MVLSTPRKPFGIWKILSLTISSCVSPFLTISVSSIKNFQLANLQESQSRPCWAIGIGVLICRCMASPWVNLLYKYIMDVLVPIKFQICKRKCTCFHIINIALIYAGMKTTYSRNISWRGVHYMAEQTWQWHWASCHETVRRGWVLLCWRSAGFVTCKQTDRDQGRALEPSLVHEVSMLIWFWRDSDLFWQILTENDSWFGNMMVVWD